MIYRSTRQEILDLLTPSALSIGVAIIGSFATVGYALYTAFYRGSTFDYYNTVLSQEPASLQGKLEVAKMSVNTNNHVADASVFMTWLIIGLAVYSCISAVGHLLAWSAGFKYTLKITRGTQRPHVMIEVLARFLLRLLGILLIFGLFKMMLYSAAGSVVTL